MSLLLADIGKILFSGVGGYSRQVFWRWRRLRVLPAVSPAVFRWTRYCQAVVYVRRSQCDPVLPAGQTHAPVSALHETLLSHWHRCRQL